MNEGASGALQQAAAAPAGPDYSFFLMMGVVFLIFYVLVMRPQQKQQKQKEEAIRGAVKGALLAGCLQTAGFAHIAILP